MNKEQTKHYSEVTKDEWDRIHKQASQTIRHVTADMLIMRRDWEQQPIIERLDKIIELLERLNNDRTS